MQFYFFESQLSTRDIASNTMVKYFILKPQKNFSSSKCSAKLLWYFCNCRKNCIKEFIFIKVNGRKVDLTFPAKLFFTMVSITSAWSGPDFFGFGFDFYKSFGFGFTRVSPNFEYSISGRVRVSNIALNPSGFRVLRVLNPKKSKKRHFLGIGFQKFPNFRIRVGFGFQILSILLSGRVRVWKIAPNPSGFRVWVNPIMH